MQAQQINWQPSWATPYAQRPTRPANDKSFNGIGGIGLNYQTAVGAIAGGGFISQAYDVANFSTSKNATV